MKEDALFQSKLDDIAKNYEIKKTAIDNAYVLEIPFKGEIYSIFFSHLDVSSAIMVIQAYEDIADFPQKKCTKILECNSIIQSSFASFFIHIPDENSEKLPLLYQTVFPYGDFSIPDCISYIENFITNFSKNISVIEDAEKSSSKTGKSSFMRGQDMDSIFRRGQK